mmetsp:Transcript_12003/g.32322  ORF Transcript_12003/g.32322 Transcript_12003/m.32322 type:complete len:107 (+) Transcript_12003:90-410(+)
MFAVYKPKAARSSESQRQRSSSKNSTGSSVSNVGAVLRSLDVHRSKSDGKPALRFRLKKQRQDCRIPLSEASSFDDLIKSSPELVRACKAEMERTDEVVVEDKWFS